MSLPEDRRERAEAQLVLIREMDGVVAAETDDFNSYSIDVFVRLEVTDRALNGNARSFAVPWHVVIRRLGNIITERFEILDWPSNANPDPKATVRDFGYNTESIKILLYV